jgi:ribosomal protein S18 acetylase RimI-like enzyme
LTIDLKILRSGEEDVLLNVASEVFDHAIDLERTREFLRDARHHLAVALDAGQVVGFVSAVDYIHPDKPAELWINEIGVVPTHRRRGIGKRLLTAMFDLARELGCTEAWVLTNRSNTAAMHLYQALGATEPDDDTVYFTFTLDSNKQT